MKCRINHSWRFVTEPRSGVRLTPRAAATDGNLQHLTETTMPESNSTGTSPVDRAAVAGLPQTCSPRV